MQRTTSVSQLCTFLALLTAAMLVAGCGGSGGTAPSQIITGESSPLSPTLIASADAICKRLDIKLATVAPKSLAVSEIARFAPARAKLEQATVDELSKLEPPASSAPSWREILAYRHTLARELAQLGREAKANNKAGIHALEESKQRVHNKLRVTGTRAGFKYCQEIK